MTEDRDTSPKPTCSRVEAAVRALWVRHDLALRETALALLVYVTLGTSLCMTAEGTGYALTVCKGLVAWGILFNLLFRNRLIFLATVIAFSLCYVRLMVHFIHCWPDQLQYHIVGPMNVLRGLSLYGCGYTNLPTNLLVHLPFAVLGIDIRLVYGWMIVGATVIVFLMVDDKLKLPAIVLVGMNPILVMTSLGLESNIVAVFFVLAAFSCLARLEDSTSYACVLLALAYCTKEYVAISFPFLFIFLLRQHRLKFFLAVGICVFVILFPFFIRDPAAFIHATVIFPLSGATDPYWYQRHDVTTFSFMTVLAVMGFDHEKIWQYTPCALLQAASYTLFLVAFWRKREPTLRDFFAFSCLAPLPVILFAHSVAVYERYFIVLLVPALLALSDTAPATPPAWPRKRKMLLHGAAGLLLAAYMGIVAVGVVCCRQHAQSSAPREFTFDPSEIFIPAPGGGSGVRPDCSPARIFNPLDGCGWLRAMGQTEFRVLVPDGHYQVTTAGVRVVDAASGQPLAASQAGQLTVSDLCSSRFTFEKYVLRFDQHIQNGEFSLPFPTHTPAVPFQGFCFTFFENLRLEIHDAPCPSCQQVRPRADGEPGGA